MGEFSQSVYYDFSGPWFLLIEVVSELLIFSFANPLAYRCISMVTNAEMGIKSHHCYFVFVTSFAN